MKVVSKKLRVIAAKAFYAGQFSCFKRLQRISYVLAEVDTDKQLDEKLADELGKEEPHESPEEGEISDENTDESEEDIDKEAAEGFAGMGMGGLNRKPRNSGTHPKDVAIGKPDWWSKW